MTDVTKARREMALDQLRTRFGAPQPPVGALNPRNPSDMDVIGWALAELLECVGDEAVARAEKAEAEAARMRPVVEAAIDAENANGVGTRAEWIEALGNVSEAVHDYRAAGKEDR